MIINSKLTVMVQPYDLIGHSTSDRGQVRSRCFSSCV